MIGELFRVFGRIGLLSFGGPAAQIALMHKELVETRDWLSEEEFLRALSFCMLLPGPEAMQLATYAGWKKQGIIGGLIGGGLFVLPGAIVIMCLALSYGAYGNLPVVQALFLGVKATVVIIVIEALIKISKRALIGRIHNAIAICGFVALFFFQLPFPLVIGIAALFGAATTTELSTKKPTTTPNLRSSLWVIAIGALIWAAPFGLIGLWDQTFLLQIGAFFSKLAVVTFGGAYAVLAYMTQEVVGGYQWLSTAQMMDALGLAETTPGPLILVTQFVGMIAGMAEGGAHMALLAGGLTLWVTFVPCFIWIFAGAPLISWLDGRPKLRGALSGITAAVVGVIGNLSLWFALHVFFGTLRPVNWGTIETLLPVWNSAQPLAIGLSLLSGGLLIRRHWSMPVVLVISALLSLVVQTAIDSI